jgi:hypothetical protein
MYTNTLETPPSFHKPKVGFTEKANSLIVTNILCSIRTKSLIILIVAFLIFYAAILGLVLGIFPNAFYSFESSEMNINSRRINRVLHDVGNDLAQFTTQNIAAFSLMQSAQVDYNNGGDYATYAAFVDQYWGASTFVKWKLDFFCLLLYEWIDRTQWSI